MAAVLACDRRPAQPPLGRVALRRRAGCPATPPDVTAPPSRHEREGLTLHRTPDAAERRRATTASPAPARSACSSTAAPTSRLKDLRRLVNEVQIQPPHHRTPSLRPQLKQPAAGRPKALQRLLAEGPARRDALPPRGPPVRAQRRTRPPDPRPQRHRRRLRGRLLLPTTAPSSSRPTATTSTARDRRSRTTARSGSRSRPAAGACCRSATARSRAARPDGRRARGDHPQAAAPMSSSATPKPRDEPGGRAGVRQRRRRPAAEPATSGSVACASASRRRRRRPAAQYT